MSPVRLLQWSVRWRKEGEERKRESRKSSPASLPHLVPVGVFWASCRSEEARRISQRGCFWMYIRKKRGRRMLTSSNPSPPRPVSPPLLFQRREISLPPSPPLPLLSSQPHPSASYHLQTLIFLLRPRDHKPLVSNSALSTSSLSLFFPQRSSPPSQPPWSVAAPKSSHYAQSLLDEGQYVSRGGGRII